MALDWIVSHIGRTDEECYRTCVMHIYYSALPGREWVVSVVDGRFKETDGEENVANEDVFVDSPVWVWMAMDVDDGAGALFFDGNGGCGGYGTRVVVCRRCGVEICGGVSSGSAVFTLVHEVLVVQAVVVLEQAFGDGGKIAHFELVANDGDAITTETLDELLDALTHRR